MTTTTLRRILGTGLGCLALGVSAVTFVGPAGAATDGNGPARHLTAEQRQCLQDQGITRPIRPLTKEKVQALRAAAQACDITLPHRHHRRHLTAEQRQCLQDQGITRPIRPLTKEKVQALRDAAQACGIRQPKAAASQT